MMKFWNDILERLDRHFSANENQIISELQNKNKNLISLNTNLNNQLDMRQASILELNSKIETMDKEIKIYNDLMANKELENYWNNKRPKVNITHKAIDGNDIDPRIFLTKDNTIYYPSKGSNDDKANLCLKYVQKKITYVSDEKENWQHASQ